MDAIRILFVEDDPGDAELFQFMLDRITSHRFEVQHVKRLEAALEQLGCSSYDAVLLDLSLPDSFGLESIQRIYDRHPEVPIVVLTGLEDASLGLHAVHAGAQDYLAKSELNATLLTRTLLHAIERQARMSSTLRQQALQPPEPDATEAVPSPTPVTLRTPPSAARRKQPLSGPETANIQRLGDFVIDTQIGKGGMGIVFRATQLALQRTVALKVLSRGYTEDPAFCKRFLKEARSAAALTHPHVVQIFTVDLDEESRRLYFAMEYLEGQNLGELLDERQPSLGESLTIARGIASALEHAWSKGIVHRDIKPGNVMVGPKAHVKVLDFGLARSVHDDTGLTGTGDLLGTPETMAPEQARKGAKADGRADLYALGVLLYRMLAGAMPFEGDSAASLIFLHSYAAPRRIRPSRPEVPVGFEAVLERLLAKRPEDRYPDPTALLAALAELREELRAGRLLEVVPTGPAVRPIGFWEAQEAAAAKTQLEVGARPPSRSGHRASLPLPGRAEGAPLGWLGLAAGLAILCAFGVWALLPSAAGLERSWGEARPLWSGPGPQEMRGSDGSTWRIDGRSALAAEAGRLALELAPPWRVEGYLADFGAAAFGVELGVGEGTPLALRVAREEEGLAGALVRDGVPEALGPLDFPGGRLAFAVSASADSAKLEVGPRCLARVALPRGAQSFALRVDEPGGGEGVFLKLGVRRGE